MLRSQLIYIVHGIVKTTRFVCGASSIAHAASLAKCLCAYLTYASKWSVTMNHGRPKKDDSIGVHFSVLNIAYAVHTIEINENKNRNKNSFTSDSDYGHGRRTR